LPEDFLQLSDLGGHRTGNSSAKPISKGEGDTATSKSLAFDLTRETCGTGRLSDVSWGPFTRQPRDPQRDVVHNQH
jgi:hypothetical protein